MKFVDTCEVKVIAGNGGNGCIAFRREKFVPHGGPSGGDGGKGGDIIFETDPGLSTLLDLAHTRTLQADKGEHGRGKDQYGRGGPDFVVRMPVGTQIFDASTGELLYDLDQPNVRTVIARGGRGGRGNIHFSSPYDRAPRRAEPGEPGEEKKLRLDLKVMADVGLLGFPNVGKSTFIRAVSHATPKVADYPFTTLIPHLGLVAVGEQSTKKREAGASFVLADIPGLIPGASEGAGLGIRFLKHVERTRALLHLVTLDPSEGREPLADYDAIMKELAQFNPELAKRPQIVAMSKADIPEVQEAYAALKPKFAKRKIDLKLVSAATRAGVESLVYELFAMVKRGDAPRDDEPEPDDEPTLAAAAPEVTKREAKSAAPKSAKRTTKPRPAKAAKRAAVTPAKKKTAKRAAVTPAKKKTAKRAAVTPAKKKTAKRAAVTPAKKKTAKRAAAKPKRQTRKRSAR